MAVRRSKADVDKLKEHAKMLYINDNIPQKEIAERLNLRPNSVSKWALDGKWEKLKKNFVLTRQEQMGYLLDELAELNASIKKKQPGLRFADSKEGDVRRKLIKDIKELETKASKPEAIGACIALIDFIRKASLSVAQELAPYIDGFIKSLL